MDRPGGSSRSKLKTDVWNTYGLAEFSCQVVQDLYLNVAMVELLDYQSCLFYESCFNRHVAHEGTYHSDFRSEVM